MHFSSFSHATMMAFALLFTQRTPLAAAASAMISSRIVARTNHRIFPTTTSSPTLMLIPSVATATRRSLQSRTKYTYGSTATSLALFGKEAAAAATAAALQEQYAHTAINYFTSIRIPAALIAGSSLSNLFTLVRESQDDNAKSRSVLQTIVLVIYHILALTSLTLSLNVIVTSTATANTILLWNGFQQQGQVAAVSSSSISPSSIMTWTSPHAFLTQEYPFEFLVTRWSFFFGLFSFLGSVAARALIEFRLLCKRRVRSALLVVSCFSALFFHLLSFVNSRIYPYSHFGMMTKAVITQWFQRPLTNEPNPCEMASIACFFASVGLSISLFLRSRLFSRDMYDFRSSISDINGDTSGSSKEGTSDSSENDATDIIDDDRGTT